MSLTQNTTTETRRPEPAPLTNHVVVITGASAGVGRATARRFASAGASVALLARGEDGLRAAREEAERSGVRALSVAVDVADANALENAAERVENELGPIDIWVNNAMTSVFSRLDKLTPAEFKRVTEVTYLGTVYGTMAALRRMRARDRGTIVQVGSALAYRSIPLQSAYCGAKHAIRGFTDSLRVELLHDKSNIHVTMVQLPGVNTPQFDWCRNKMSGRAKPIGAVFQPEVAARAIEWAATHRRREVTVGWPAMKAVYGNKLVPKFADRKLARIGFEGQQEGPGKNAARPDNLFEPVPGDYGAHGRFDDDAIGRSVQLELNLNRAAALAFGALTVGTVLVLASRLRCA